MNLNLKMKKIRLMDGITKICKCKMPMLFHYRQAVSFLPPVFDTMTF